MPRPTADREDRYLDYADPMLVPGMEAILVERHLPKVFVAPYHHHASIELNYLIGCEMVYSFAGEEIAVPPGQLVMFWGALPHCVTDVQGKGQTVNVYVSLSRFLSWNLPKRFADALIGGDVICDPGADHVDALAIPRWARDFAGGDTALKPIVAGDVEMRVRRLAASGWKRMRAGPGSRRDAADGLGRMHAVEEMLRYIAENFSAPVKIADVAAHVRLSESYAMTLFRRGTGISIKEHLTRTRLSHAQMLLAHSDAKILTIAMDSGFGSLSAFYEAFESRAHQSPAAFRRQSRA